jgi:hypothetical protein
MLYRHKPRLILDGPPCSRSHFVRQVARLAHHIFALAFAFALTLDLHLGWEAVKLIFAA